ncbi:hypothetical protein KW790_02490 [Candidatus Parcubacteria bacterium]|nr:hypothetical protein [Candidatus Parcubacteria bacterium]
MKDKLIKSFKDKRILLVGDAILDVYIYGVAAGQGLGTSVPRIEEKKVETSFGGNGLIAKNLLELGGKVFFITVVGDDEDARYYDNLTHSRLKKYFIVDKTRPTIVKRRIFTGDVRTLHLNKVDHRDIDPSIERKVIKNIDSLINKVDAIVAMDPQHGLLTKKVINHLKKISKEKNIPLYIDTQISHRPSNHHFYKGAHTMFLNEGEAKAVYPKFNSLKAGGSLEAIKKKLDLKNVIVKLGDHGSIALINNKFIKTPAIHVEAVDPCGAGDAFMSAFSLGDLDFPEETLYIANAWAALSATIPGTTPPKMINLKKLLRD